MLGERVVKQAQGVNASHEARVEELEGVLPAGVQFRPGQGDRAVLHRVATLRELRAHRTVRQDGGGHHELLVRGPEALAVDLLRVPLALVRQGDRVPAAGRPAHALDVGGGDARVLCQAVGASGDSGFELGDVAARLPLSDDRLLLVAGAKHEDGRGVRHDLATGTRYAALDRPALRLRADDVPLGPRGVLDGVKEHGIADGDVEAPLDYLDALVAVPQAIPDALRMVEHVGQDGPPVVPSVRVGSARVVAPEVHRAQVLPDLASVDVGAHLVDRVLRVADVQHIPSP